MSKYDKERTEAAKRFVNVVHDRKYAEDARRFYADMLNDVQHSGIKPTRQDVVLQVTSGSKHTQYDRDAQLEWLQQDAWEDRLAEEARNDWVVILCVAMVIVFGWFLLNGVADYVSGMPV